MKLVNILRTTKPNSLHPRKAVGFLAPLNFGVDIIGFYKTKKIKNSYKTFLKNKNVFQLKKIKKSLGK